MPRSSITQVSDLAWKNRLRKIMAERNISQRELSRMCQIGATSVRHSLQPDTDIMLSTIHLYAKRLGVSPHWLIFGKEA